MKVLLVAFPSSSISGKFVRDVMPPLAIYVLAAVLKEHSHEVITIDPNLFAGVAVQDFESKLREIVIPHNADVIGISSNSFNYSLAMRAAIAIKTLNSDIIIVGGGLHVSIFDKYVMETAPFDYIVRGEGETSLTLLLDSIENNLAHLQYIPGLTYRDDDRLIQNCGKGLHDVATLEQFPLPAYDMIPPSVYDTIAVETSRGCRYSCAFCSIQHRKSWRGFSVENVLSRISNAKRHISSFNYKNVINFSDDCFTEDSERALEILNRLRQERDGFKYFFEARVSNLLKNNLVEQIDPSLVFQMQIGVECGYNAGLRTIHKGITIEQLFECLTKMKQTGLNKKAFLSFIIGFPWEGVDEINLTLDTIKIVAEKYEALCNLNWLIFLPSEIWDKRALYQINVDEGLFNNFMWYTNPDYFFSCHPRISRNDFKLVCKCIFNMQAYCDLIKYNVPIFLDNI